MVFVLFVSLILILVVVVLCIILPGFFVVVPFFAVLLLLLLPVIVVVMLVVVVVLSSSFFPRCNRYKNTRLLVMSILEAWSRNFFVRHIRYRTFKIGDAWMVDGYKYIIG